MIHGVNCARYGCGCSAWYGAAAPPMVVQEQRQKMIDTPKGQPMVGRPAPPPGVTFVRPVVPLSQVHLDDLTMLVPPHPMSPEGWDKWTVRDVIALTGAILHGDGNDDRARYGTYFDALIVGHLLNGAWPVASTTRAHKSAVIATTLKMLPIGATFTIDTLMQEWANVSQEPQTYADLWALFKREMTETTNDLLDAIPWKTAIGVVVAVAAAPYVAPFVPVWLAAVRRLK